MYISSYPTHVRMNAEKMVKYTRWGHTRSKLYMKLQTFSPTSLPSKNPYSTKIRTSLIPPSQFQKHTMSTLKWMVSHTTFFFLYVTRKYVGLGEQMHRASKNTGSWMEWAFFVGDMERENIAVTMEWDGLHFRGWHKVNIQNFVRAFGVVHFMWHELRNIWTKRRRRRRNYRNKAKKNVEEEFHNGVYGLIDCACEL